MNRLVNRLALSCLLVAASALSALAQPAVRREKTPGGLSYLISTMPRTTLQSLQLIWRDGSQLTLPGKEALTSVAPYLMSDGIKGEKRGELNELLRDLQGGFRFSMATDSTSLTISAPPEHFAQTVALVRRYIENPALSEERLVTYKRERQISARQSLLNPETQANQLRLRALLPESPLRRLVLVDPAEFERVSTADVDAWRKAILARDTVQIASAGPMPAATVSGVIDALAAALTPKASRSEPPAVAMQATTKVRVLERSLAQTIVQAFGSTSVKPGNFEALKADIAISAMTGLQGRVWIALREKLGATYGASMQLDSIEWNMRAVSIRSAVEHDKAAAVVDAIRQEYRRWRADGITKEEFDGGKARLAGSRKEGRRVPGNVAGALISAQYYGLPDDYFRAYDKAFAAVTLEEVNAYIKANFPEELAFAIIAPSASALKADCVIKSLSEAATCD